MPAFLIRGSKAKAKRKGGNSQYEIENASLVLVSNYITLFGSMTSGLLFSNSNIKCLSHLHAPIVFYSHLNSDNCFTVS